MPTKDKAILKKHRDAWYYKNKQKQIDKQMSRRQELFAWLTSYKCSLKCLDCGCSFAAHPEWVDFHHLDPLEKDGEIREAAISSRQKLLKEIAKCVPLCANCHRTRHAQERIVSSSAV